MNMKTRRGTQGVKPKITVCRRYIICLYLLVVVVVVVVVVKGEFSPHEKG
ncbi:hypothetical protein E2C01_072799 [Portunus trituberculatus]|uniref:Uncharacterized protein n=1 Tax=Portunus trituberculatus TaxID=210409 RepID=A0A5B7I851_PORTR|nr:hypothetical protein [Portunus trituberculatus]